MADFTSKIRHIRETLKLSRRALSELLDVPEGKIQKIEIGDQRADHEFLSHLGKTVGADINWLLDSDGEIVEGFFPATFHDHAELTEKASKGIIPSQAVGPSVDADFVPIPRFLVDAAAGDGALVDEETQTGFYAFNRSWLTRRKLAPDNLAVISVRGDSMEPKLSDGDLILVDQAQVEIADGITYVIRLGNDLLVKYVQRISPDAVSLLSENNRYPPREISLATIGEDTAIIGRVVASMHEW
ncbi:XRE family transcriptional regulator [Candidatus Rhodobacter oscarellae]|nr:XRE family transcriptional regulator [Candidatus Rhodobacter lobularis]